MKNIDLGSTIINKISGIENKSYLELGIFDNKNFNQIKSQNKFSVDVNGLAMFTGTTDEYFKQLDSSIRFDIIFIDANHDYEYVIRDFNNSVKRCNEWILVHDMIPPGKKYTKSYKCSDSFRVLYFLLTETNFEIYPMNNNFGLTLIKMPANEIKPDLKFSKIGYGFFMEFINENKIYSDEEIIRILNR